MNNKQKKRLIIICTMASILIVAATLVLYALKQNINLFFTPTQILETVIKPDQFIRVGGYVKNGSVHFGATGETVDFIVTDRQNELAIKYHGMLPNLFREGQTVVVTGQLNNQHEFIATEVLAKHDEKYMPKPLAEKLKGTDHGA